MDVQQPIITEKSMGLAARGWYTFAVAKHARKERIIKEVEAMYHVEVLCVRTVAMHGKVRRTGKKMTPAHRPDWKKAIVQLKAGQKIDAFEISTQPADVKAMAGKEPEKVQEVKKIREEKPTEGKKTTKRKTIKTDEGKKAR